MGWGSGTAEYPYLSAPLDAIKSRASRDGTTITTSTTDNPSSGSSAAAAASTAIVFINANSGEEYIKVEGHDADRANLDPWNNGNDLVAAVGNAGKPTIVVIHSVGPVILERILASKNVVAIVWAGLPGQESGNALVDILYGDTAPNGKLPYTIAKREQDYSVSLAQGNSDSFREGIYIDYRQFDKAGITPRYEFGFGLCKHCFHLTLAESLSILLILQKRTQRLPTHHPQQVTVQCGDPALTKQQTQRPKHSLKRSSPSTQNTAQQSRQQ